MVYRPPLKQPVQSRGASLSTPVSHQQRAVQHRPASRPLERGNPFRRDGHSGAARPRKLPHLDEDEGHAASNDGEAHVPEEDLQPGEICLFNAASPFGLNIVIDQHGGDKTSSPNAPAFPRQLLTFLHGTPRIRIRFQSCKEFVLRDPSLSLYPVRTIRD